MTHHGFRRLQWPQHQGQHAGGQGDRSRHRHAASDSLATRQLCLQQLQGRLASMFERLRPGLAHFFIQRPQQQHVQLADQHLWASDPGCRDQMLQIRTQRMLAGIIERHGLQLLTHARHRYPILENQKHRLDTGSRRVAGFVHHALQPARRKNIHVITHDQLSSPFSRNPGDNNKYNIAHTEYL